MKEKEKLFDGIIVMVPTYKRPERLRRLVDSAYTKSDSPFNIRFCLCINQNDVETKKAVLEWYWPVRPFLLEETTDQPDLPQYFNMMYEATNSIPDSDRWLISMFGDDMYVVTKNWDKIILDALNESDGLSLVYGDDDFIAHEKLCVHFVTSRKLVRATGKNFMCPLFRADMIDLVWYRFAQLTGILNYIPSLHIRHEHDSRLHHTQWDDTMKRMVPIRQANNGELQNKICEVYATQMAANAIENEPSLQWNRI